MTDEELYNLAVTYMPFTEKDRAKRTREVPSEAWYRYFESVYRNPEGNENL